MSYDQNNLFLTPNDFHGKIPILSSFSLTLLNKVVSIC